MQLKLQLCHMQVKARSPAITATAVIDVISNRPIAFHYEHGKGNWITLLMPYSYSLIPQEG